jgi:hypothetical protein
MRPLFLTGAKTWKGKTMSVVKQLIMPDRIRVVPPGFGWVDHRFVRDRHIEGLSGEALSLYLFLITVADGEGLSHWSPRSIARLLSVSSQVVEQARCELEGRNLLAFDSPLWQVLSLPRGGDK